MTHPSARPRASAALCAMAAAALLSACSGGGEDAAPTADAAAQAPNKRAQAVTLNPGGWVAVTQPADALLQNLAIPADAPARGMWSAPGDWPMVGLHQAVLPDGKVLTWGTTPDGGAQNGRYFDLWDPSRGLADAGSHSFTYDPNRQDSFCAPAVYLADGRLMITGGNGDVTSQLYTPASNSYALGARVADGRWYAAMATLPDGRPIMLGGINPYTEGQWNNPDQAVTQGLASMTPEVLENGSWRTLFGAQSRTAFGPDFLRASLPKVWTAPDGRVFGIATEQLFYVDPNANGGNGITTIVGGFKTAPSATATNDTAPNVGPTMSAVMFAPGRVLAVGGNAYHNGLGWAGSRKATAIDLNGGGAVLAEQPAMAFPRHFANTIVLPDGKVLVTGGETRANNDPALGVFAAEAWNPATGAWTTLASARIFRGYHSQTSLLTNGTVLSTGGGNPGPVQRTGEVFYPPYLFRSVNGVAQLAPRPQMVGISGRSHASGAQLQVDMAGNGPVAQLVLIGLSVGTHSFNSGQRRIPLAFTQEDIRLTATLPSANLAPPGFYQLIALDAAGVPSRGMVIGVGQGVTTPPGTVTPYNPPTIGGSIAAPVIASGGTASYSVAATTGVSYSWSFGDGTAATPFSPTASISHAFAAPGVYGVTLTARTSAGATTTRSFLQAVVAPAIAGRPVASSALALEPRSGVPARLWVANPDNDSVAVLDTATNARVAEIAVGASPRNVALAPDGRLWVTNKGASTISILNPATLTVAATVALPRAAQPHGLVFAPGGSAFVALEATGQLLKLDPANGAVQATLGVGAHPRHLSATANGATVLVSRFITNPLPGEGTATVDTSAAGAEVLAVNAGPMTLARTVVLRHSDKVDNEVQGAGIPNYLAAAVIAPDGRSAWVPSKQDNIKRGQLRNGQALNFQNSVRAISSRIDLATLAEDQPRRIDHDNSSLGSAAAFHPSGAYLFVALETSRQVAVVDPVGGRELARIDAGRAPQALALSADGQRLYVQNFMDRTVSVLDLGPLLTQGLLNLPVLGNVLSVGADKLPTQVLQGKQLFYDARDPRLARDSYMSCASCHSDAGHDGRTWDFTGFGEGLRNTPALKGRAGIGQGFVHWSANFDEIQDFEGQIRAFAGGTGLMSDAQFNTGSRSQPLGDRKSGISADLDALAAYMGSLNTFDNSPLRNPDGTLTAAAVAGRTVFANANCASCHGGAGFTGSADAGGLRNIGTLRPASGTRLGAALTGLDVPTLRDAWRTGPYLHDGSAPSLAAAVQAHNGNTVAGTDLVNLVAYLQQIGAQEAAAPGTPPPPTANGTGLTGSYFNNPALTGTPVLTRTEAPWFDWGVGAPAASVPADNFSVRWTGQLQAIEAGNYQFRTNSDDGVRVWVNGVLLIDNWTAHAPTVDTSGTIALAAGQRVSIVVEFQEFGGGAMLQLSWLRPGGAWAQVPTAQLYPAAAAPNQPPTAALTAPAAGTSAAVGTAINLAASAADADGTVARVEFYAGSTLLGTDTTAPYGLAWTPTAAGTVALTARAVDNTGAATTSAAVTLNLNAALTTPPATAAACANEGGTCTLPAGSTATVWYGAGSSWAVRTGITGSIGCNNTVFGDPLVGTVKRCVFLVTSASNLAPGATLATSYVSPWETLAAVNNNLVPANSADRSSGAYGNWRGAAGYGATDWVSFTWPTPRTLTAFEVYWWNDGQGIGTPTAAQVEVWNGSAWVAVGAPGLALNTFNRISFAPVTTTAVRVSMRSALATGILEARAWGTLPAN